MTSDCQVALDDWRVPTPGTPWFENQGWRRTISITNIITISIIITTTTATTRLHIDLVQTSRKPHIASVRPRTELAETSIAVNHSIDRQTDPACLHQ